MERVIGMIVGILVGILFVYVVSKIANRYNDKGEKKYDERQKAIRGVGYCIGLYVLIALIFVKDIIISTMTIRVNSNMILTLDILAILISLFVFLVYCVMHDAYLTISERPKSVIILTLFLGIFNFVIALFSNHNHTDRSILEQSSFINFAVSVFCLGIGLMVLIKYYLIKDRED